MCAALQRFTALQACLRLAAALLEKLPGSWRPHTIAEPERICLCCKQHLCSLQLQDLHASVPDALYATALVRYTPLATRLHALTRLHGKICSQLQPNCSQECHSKILGQGHAPRVGLDLDLRGMAERLLVLCNPVSPGEMLLGGSRCVYRYPFTS